MSRHFEVIGDVMGDDDDVEGYDPEVESGVQVVGYDDNGYPIVVGAPRKKKRPKVLLSKPGWRGSQLAPGVIAPDQGMLPLPMGTFTYTLANQINTFQGQVQKPFRGERFLSRIVRTGASATGTILAQIFVGTDLAMLDTPQVDLESLSNPAAFGVRLTMKPAQPGVFIRAITALSVPLAGADTIQFTLQLLGRNIG